MLTITERLLGRGPVNDHLVLPFDQRQKSRMRVKLASGEEAALTIERGSVLRGGDRLRASDGRIIAVVAAPQSVSRVTAQGPFDLLRAAYHLGNRHVPLEIGQNWLRLEQDHVLDHMLEHLGVTVAHETAPFEPEAGAYGGGHHHHHGDDDHPDDHHDHHPHP
jgi:urease accessory protein